MAKSKGELAVGLAPTGDQFFDRVIGFRLSQNIDGNVPDLVFNCPEFGEKPIMRLQFKMLPEDYVGQITLTISNMYLNIDMCTYKYLTVTAGYRGRGRKKGLTRTFRGEIINAYNESPNPNGAFVIQCVLGQFSSLSDNNQALVLDSDTVGTTFAANMQCLSKLLKSIAPQMEVDYSDIPKQWYTVSLFPNTTFKDVCYSGLELLDKFRYKLQTVGNILGLPPLNLFLEDNIVRVYSFSDEPMSDKLKAVTMIGTAYIEGDRGVVTAPWNPTIHVGDLVYIPRVFFRSRISLRQFNSASSYQTDTWKVYTMTITFGTTGAVNQMNLELINMRNNIGKGGKGYSAQDYYRGGQ